MRRPTGKGEDAHSATHHACRCQLPLCAELRVRRDPDPWKRSVLPLHDDEWDGMLGRLMAFDVVRGAFIE